MSCYSPGEIDWLDLSVKMTLQAHLKFNKITMRIGDAPPVVVSPKTALNEAHRRRWHLRNIAFLDLDSSPGCSETESPQCARMVDFFVTHLLDPYMKKDIRHLLPWGLEEANRSRRD